MSRTRSHPFNLTAVLEQNKRAVDRLIFDFLPNTDESPEIALLYRMMRDYPLRPGKGLRVSLCLLTCESFGGKSEDALTTAAALELFHNWILIHDDIEDMSEMRRKEPVLHRMYGIPLAINAGDALHARMWELLMRNRQRLGDGKTLNILEEFKHVVNETTEGQHMELTWVQKDEWDLDEDDYTAMCAKKTCWYSFISPCRLGGIVAGARDEDLDAFIPFGSDLGVAFQIQDDILNLEGKEARYGKEFAGDIWEGKRTLILIRLLKVCNAADRRVLLSIMNKKREEKSHEEIMQVLSLMKKYGAIEYARKRASEFASRARKSLEKLSSRFRNKSAQAALSATVDFVIRREW